MATMAMGITDTLTLFTVVVGTSAIVADMAAVIIERNKPSDVTWLARHWCER